MIDSDDATFTVDPVLIIGNIPDQRAPFKTFDLDDYLSRIDPDVVTWSATDPGDGWGVDIDGDNVVTVTAPGGAIGTKIVTFTATAICCGGDMVSDWDDAAFTISPLATPPTDIPSTTPIGTAILIGSLSLLAVGRIRRRFN